MPMDGLPLDYRQLERELDSGLRSLDPEAGGPDTLLPALVAAAAAAGDRPRLRAALRLAQAAGIGAAAVRETVLQVYLFAGYPRAINALADVAGVYGHAPDAGRLDLEPHPGDEAQWLEEGQALCRRVYGEAYPRLLETMARVSPDLGRWMIVEGYGKVLSRPGLAPRLRELAAVAALAVLAVPSQLRAHLRGALLVGASPAEVAGALAAAALVAPGERDRARRLLQDLLEGR